MAEKAQVALIELNRQEPPEQHALYQSDDPDCDYYDDCDGPRCTDECPEDCMADHQGEE